MKKLVLLLFISFFVQFSPSYAAGMKVVDVTPTIYIQQPAVAIIFDRKVDINSNYDDYIFIEGINSKGIVDVDQQIIYYIGLQHSTSYSVTIDAGLKGQESGVTLGSKYSKVIKTNALTTSARFASPGMVVVPSDKAVLPVTVSNIDTILVSFYRTSIQNRKDWFTEDANVLVNAYDLSREALEGYSFVTSKAYNVNAINRQFYTSLDLPKELFEQPGVYKAVVQGSSDHYYLSTSTFIISDLGIQLRKHPDGRWDIWARSFKTGLPIEGVTGRFVYNDNDSQMSIDSTDATGHAVSTPTGKGNLRMFVAEHGNNVAIVNMSRAMDLSNFDIVGREHANLQVYVYGPRDLYRGGETARWNMLVRNYDGKLVDPGSMQIVLTDPKGEEKEKKTVRVDKAYGLYEYSFNLPDNAATGVWKLSVTVGKNITVHNFSVEDFMPETMRLILGKPGEPLIVNKATATQLSAHGEYLYGAAAAGNSIEGTYEVLPAMSISDKWRDYSFAHDETTNRSRNNDLDYGKLSDAGDYRWNISDNPAIKAIEATKQPVKIRYFVTLYESGGRAINRLKEYVYLPTGGAIGIKADYKDYASTNVPTNFSIININSAGVATKAQLSVTLMRDERSYYWDYNPDNGWRYYYTSAAYPLQTIDTEVGTKPLDLPFQLNHGYYKLAVKNRSTQQETIIDIVAGRDWYDEDEYADNSGGSKGKVIKPDELTLTLDKQAYTEGDKARVTVSSPYDGEGMLFVETANGLLRSQKITIKGNNTTVIIPIGTEWNRHDIYISAHVARNEKEVEKTQQSLVYGIVHLPIDRQARKIELDTIYPASVEPDTDFQVLIRAKDGAKSAGAMITLAAVDQGILSLKAFDTPDAWKYFFGKKRYGSIIYDNFWQVIHKYSPRMATRYGGDGLAAAGGALARTDVNIVSFFSKPIKLDAKGEARIKLNIPSYNGELRMMTMAFSKDAFGMDEGVLKVAQPIVTELSTPRFMATGDAVELALDLRNMTSVRQNLTVSVTVGQPLQSADGNTSHKLTLNANQRQILQIPVKAVGSSGYGTVKINVSGIKNGATSSTKEWRIAVRSPYPAVTETLQFTVAPNTPVAFYSKGLSNYVADSAYLSVSIDAVPPLGIEPHFAYLLQYPYGCLEQTTSSTFPLIFATDEVRKRYNMLLPSGKSRAELVEIGLNRLYAKQLDNGGFAYWDAQSPESPYGAVYATELMNEANKLGFNVNQERLNRANGRLAAYIRNDVKAPYSSYYSTQDQYSISTKAYAAYVLAKYGTVSLADVRDIYSRSANSSFTPVPLMQLAIALKKSGDMERAQDAFDRAMSMTQISDRYYGDYSSPVREKAWMVTLYDEYTDGRGDKAMSMLLDVSKNMAGRNWYSTQERLRLFIAATTATSDEIVNGTITANGKTEAVNAKSYTGVWRAQSLEKEIGFTSTNEKSVFAQVEFSAYPLTKPAMQSTNATVSRTYYDTGGKPLDISNVQAGDFVLVRLDVRSKLHTADGLLVDLLPAGFELENQNLDNSLKLSSLRLPKDKNGYSPTIANIVYSEYRDDRFVAAINLRAESTASVFYIMRAVTPGAYSNTPPYFEDMYRPNIRAVGNTVPERVTVTGK